MSYCRWSNPVPEATPDVDVSFEKIIELYSEDGYKAWKKYCEDKHVIKSDAYVYEDIRGYFVCHWRDDKGTSAMFDTAKEMADYLAEKKADGANVPQYAIDALREESNGT